MGNVIYRGVRYDAATAAFNWLAGTVRAYLIDASLYSPDETHTYLSSVPEGARVAYGILANRTVTVDGGLYADDLTISSVSGATVEGLLLVFWTGTDSTSKLIMYLDNLDGLPFLPDGGDVPIAWNTGVDKIARL